MITDGTNLKSSSLRVATGFTALSLVVICATYSGNLIASLTGDASFGLHRLVHNVQFRSGKNCIQMMLIRSFPICYFIRLNRQIS